MRNYRRWMYYHPAEMFLICICFAILLTGLLSMFLGCAAEHHQVIKPAVDRIGPPTYGDVVEKDMAMPQ